jgi:hypothetical protein
MFAKTLVLSVVMAVGCFAAPPPIGIVTASGHFTLDRAEVWGNTTLFDGGNVETGSASSEAILRNGVKIQLAAASRASVRENRLTLLQGTGQIAAPENYEVNAGGLSIRSASGVGRMRVGWSTDGRIEVAALSGNARVATRAGVLLASIATGKSMQFALPQAAGAATVTRVGCLLYKDSRFFMQDQDTQEIIELAGSNLGANAGNRMSVTGVVSSARPVLTIASSVLNVTSVTLRAAGGCLSVAAVLGAQTDVQGAPDTPQAAPAAAAPPPPAGGSTPAPVATGGGGGLSTGAKVAIVAVAVGGGAGAAIALASGKKSTSP